MEVTGRMMEGAGSILACFTAAAVGIENAVVLIGITDYRITAPLAKHLLVTECRRSCAVVPGLAATSAVSGDLSRIISDTSDTLGEYPVTSWLVQEDINGDFGWENFVN
ncbi:hypothetical protein Trydic_g3830 [Trypoxylus dichotomus]